MIKRKEFEDLKQDVGALRYSLTAENFVSCEDCGCLLFMTDENWTETKLILGESNWGSFKTEKRIYKCKKCRNQKEKK